MGVRQRRNENVGAHLYLIGAELNVLGGKVMEPWPRERHRFFFLLMISKIYLLNYSLREVEAKGYFSSFK